MSNATSRRNSNIRRAAQRSNNKQQDAIDALDAKQDILDAKIDALKLITDDHETRIEVLEGE